MRESLQLIRDLIMLAVCALVFSYIVYRVVAYLGNVLFWSFA